MQYRIDAAGKKVGRLASEIALILQGKKTPAYEGRLVGEDEVLVTNIGAMEVSGLKSEQKRYYRHSGRIGSLKSRTFREVFGKNPRWILCRAVRLMLPKNRLAKPRLQKLTFEE